MAMFDYCLIHYRAKIGRIAVLVLYDTIVIDHQDIRE